ncbi:hypothetical protein EDB84DRAFT_1445184 [Lactarius hengduanensis]|nr:hypothetical protein EDB84DRAFT_1445184 [Lactarius hengduanensis]
MDYMDFPSQFPTQYSQYQPDGAGEGVVTPLGTYGNHTAGSHRGMERPNVIAAVSEQMLKQNRFYVRLQYNSMKQKEEIVALQVSNSELKKELELLKECNEMYREIINGSITKDDDQQTVSIQSKGARRVFSLTNPPPNPKLEAQEDHPDVRFWNVLEFRVETRHRNKNRGKGETNGDASMVITKPKRGRPARSDSTRSTDNRGHFYLEYHDGTLVSSSVITSLSEKSRMIWLELDDVGLAPPSFCKMTKIAFDFFWRSILAYPKFQFLLLCNSGEWKLRQWSIKSYSNWALHNGVREAKPKDTELNDPALIQMDPTSDHEDDESGAGKCPRESSDSDGQGNGDDDSGENNAPHSVIQPLVELEDAIQGHFFLCDLVGKWLSYGLNKFGVSSTKTDVTVMSQMTTVLVLETPNLLRP